MSLHRRLVLPPLALAVHPAPLPKKEESKKKEEEKRDSKREGDKKKEEDKKDGDKLTDGEKPKQGEKPKEGDKPKEDDKPKEGEKSKADEKKKNDDVGIVKAKADAAASATHPKGHPVPRSPETPGTPGSMIPEPPTPNTSVPPVAGAPAQVEQTPVDEASKVPPPQANPKSPKPGNAGSGDSVVDKKDADKEPEKDVPPPPIRLIGPVPPRPLKTRLDLDPAVPYPPINTDPRGAYYKYAKYNQGEWIMIDVVKDGWLSEQWREKPEREALARLRGESDARAKREAAKARRDAMTRKVPDSAEKILLELWNDLVEAANQEVCSCVEPRGNADEFQLAALDFWAKYDWSDPAAQKHLAATRRRPAHSAKDGQKNGSPSAQRPEDKSNTETKEARDDAKDQGAAEWDDGLDEVEWTKEGLEEILGNVGVQCSYNTPVSGSGLCSL
ncbi:hypothetical protein DB88DRAFT_264 [Papiliotrema laurentii]|uniref:Uncharacterized protein n=1 Tax=Papiliotrema laurentii TaxID=5418 RepID=A0AAD9FV89_PAPLA|nr:hypothetical protein DB88DRAFT_264 [Papiliotrema laurentii]